MTHITDLVHPSWVPTFKPHAELLNNIAMQCSKRAETKAIAPAPQHVLRAFWLPMDKIKVVIVGQDPYPTAGHAVGLSFSVNKDVQPLPRSLNNIYTELQDDLGIEPAPHGDLSHWFNQGVMLLNRSLTVDIGKPGSHKDFGWDIITDAAIRSLAEHHNQHNTPLIGVLWGRKAQDLAPLFTDHGGTTIESAHPSPLSASRGFFGSKPFSRVNDILANNKAQPIDWKIPR